MSRYQRPTEQDWNEATIADIYAKHRPRYVHVAVPWALDFFRKVTGKERAAVAIDAGCGSGQVTVHLAEFADRVVAIDIAEEMLDLARRQSSRPNIQYCQGDVRQLADVYAATGAPAADILVAGTSAHYFDCDAFYEGVRKVVRPGGVIALLGYYFTGFLNPGMETLLHSFYDQVIEGERRLLWDKVLHSYQSLHFPFRTNEHRKDEIIILMTREEVLNLMISLSPMFKNGIEDVDDFMRNKLPALDEDKFRLKMEIFSLMAKV